MTKRVIALLLTLLMLAPCIVACKKDEEPENDTEETTVAEETENKYEVYDDLGDLDFGGRTITIANVNRTWYDQEVSVERLTGDIVNDAVYKRNANVEERLNIKIKNVRFNGSKTIQYSVVDDLQKAIQANTLSYDIIHNPTYVTAAYTSRNLFYNLRNVEPLNLDGKVYWSSYFNEAASIGNGQYVATGAISLSFYRFIFATLVNNRVLNDGENAPDLIEVVKEGKWTLEYQKVLANKYYDDNGESGKDEQDNFGLVTSDYLNVDPYWSSCEIPVLHKQADGFYKYDLDTERMSNAVDKVLSLFNSDGTYCFRLDSKHETGNGEQIAIAEKFASGEALMATLRLNEIEDASIRDMADEYTILPIPRYSEDQDGYYSYIHDSFTGVSLPMTISKDDAVVFGSVIEAMASESYRTVTPAYYEIALKTRYADNQESWEMLDMITQNVKMDAATVYTQALSIDSSTTVLKIFRSMVTNAYRNAKKPDVGSAFASFAQSVEQKLNGTEGIQTKIKAFQSAQ